MNAPCKAACVAATLVGVWGSAEAESPYAYLYNDRDLTSAVGLYQYNSSAGNGETLTSPDAYGALSSATSDEPHLWDVSQYKFSNTLNTNLGLTIAGIYDDPTSSVSILLNAETANRAIAQGLDWDEVFLPGTDGYRSETSFADILRAINGEFVPYTLNDFMTDYASLMPRWNEEAVLVNFSAATPGGGGAGRTEPRPVATPEPASLVALGAGVVALARRRRRA